MWGYVGKIFSDAPPYNGMADTFASHSENKISRGHMHILYDLVGTASHHSSNTRHTAHSGPEFQIALLLNINATLFIQAVFLPYRRIFD
jgi:hypothetical protein